MDSRRIVVVMSKTQSEFLAQLQKEATFQKKLSEHRILPKQTDSVTAFIGMHVWQVLLILAVITAVLLEVIEKV